MQLDHGVEFKIFRMYFMIVLLYMLDLLDNDDGSGMGGN